MARMLNFLTILVAILILLCRSSSGIQIGYDSRSMIFDGERKLIFSGSIHYARSTPEMWPDLIQKSKDGGLDAIETYIFWNAHEPRPRQYKFEGNLDFIKFFKLIQEAGLYAILRIGPYICAEWNYGGLPVWLHNIEGCQLRTDNEIFKNEMQIFTTKIVDMCKEANLFAPQGGPIILAQIENEYGIVESSYGEAGKAYLKWCAQMAVAQNIGVPWIMCKQDDAPQPIINTCNAFYCDQNKHPNDPNSPRMFTENWTGWFTNWGQKTPHRTAEDIAFSTARYFQLGGSLMNYYMYHGGTNFGRTAGGPFLITSYDYDAPIDEYGNLNQPKWGHLKELHAAIKMGEKLITSGNVITKDLSNNVQLTTFINDATGERFCFLSNNNWERDETIDLQQDGKFFLPAWSVSILGGCQKELYNTAKVTTQTSIMVKQAENYEEDYPADPLSWMWAFEFMKDTLQGKGRFSARQLFEQTRATSDASDYLWYMTSFDNNGTTSSNNLTLYVNTSSEYLYAHYHVYVNGHLIGSQSEKSQFRSPVSLVPGRNNITLLSATNGLKQNEAFIDKIPYGITGPVGLTDNGSINIDLSSNTWKYKVGLNGEAKRFHDPNSPHAPQWKTAVDIEELPTDRSMTWYKTTFRAPSGTDPVVVDLIGMGKGQAWINGNSLGRFWPSRIADSNGCDVECNYRGEYHFGNTATKCVTNCGNPTQRWYHVPRSFLTPENNILILFEEIGGNPLQVSFQTVTVGSICASADEGSTLQLSCQDGKVISEIIFASFGDPKRTCGRSTLQQGSCHATQSQSAVEQRCIGRDSCSIVVSSVTLGSVDCGTATKRLSVQAICETETLFLKKLRMKKAGEKAV